MARMPVAKIAARGVKNFIVEEWYNKSGICNV